MKKASLCFIVGLILSLAWITVAGAELSKEEKNLERAVSTLDQQASQPQGEKMVVEQLEKAFKVDEARINNLHQQKLGYGEIAILLSLVQKMPGGTIDANIQKVLAMRQGPPIVGWEIIAQKLKEKLGPIISQMQKIAKDSQKQIEKAEPGRPEKARKAKEPEKPANPEKMEKPERPMDPDMMDRGEKLEKSMKPEKLARMGKH